MFSSLKLVFEVALLICFVRGQEDYYSDVSYTPMPEESQCISLGMCEQLKPLIKEKREILKQYHCGFEGLVPKVYCPPPLTTTPPPVSSDVCYTVENKVGSCVLLESCPRIKTMMATITMQSLDYLHRSKCSGPDLKETYVCCETNDSPNPELISRGDTCPRSAMPPDPASSCCGIDSSSGPKIVGGKEATIDQYPWLALLEYEKEPLCGGSLISNKYVLTAAHCVLNNFNEPRDLRAVLLGEYNTANSGKDCVTTAGGGVDCTLGSVRVPVESAITHPAYDTEKKVQHAHDIALLRLTEMVNFTDFIKPICLPTSDITLTSPNSMRFFVAGWGAVSERQEKSTIKLYASLPYVNHEQCLPYFTMFGESFIWDKQICAGGEPNTGSCRGDSGGPLIHEGDVFHEVVGVISFGAKLCGIQRPSVYTKVYDYLTWIYDNIKP